VPDLCTTCRTSYPPIQAETAPQPSCVGRPGRRRRDSSVTATSTSTKQRLYLLFEAGRHLAPGCRDLVVFPTFHYGLSPSLFCCISSQPASRAESWSSPFQVSRHQRASAHKRHLEGQAQTRGEKRLGCRTIVFLTDRKAMMRRLKQSATTAKEIAAHEPEGDREIDGCGRSAVVIRQGDRQVGARMKNIE
jgi:hypothetical protein